MSKKERQQKKRDRGVSKNREVTREGFMNVG